AATVAPFRGQDNQVERQHRFDLDPAGAATAGVVYRVQGLDHYPFVSVRQRLAQECLGLGNIWGDDARRAPALWDGCGQDAMPLGRGPIDEVFAIDMQDVEHKRSQRQRRAQALDIQATTEATGADLEWMRSTVRFQCQGFAIQNDRLG